MQLAHLIPHLDAEINRLQKARDLLALVPLDTHNFYAAFQKRAEPSPTLPRADLPLALAKKPSMEPTTVSPRLAEERKRQTDTPALVKDARAAIHSEPQPGRRKPSVLLDTALRGPVPAGPVFVSAEEVRKTQATKTAQAVRAAEVKKAGTELISSFGWRDRPRDGERMDVLLQRLINIGEDVAAPQKAGPPSGRQSLLPVRAPFAEKPV